jgi:hypothetical protein
MIQMVCVIKALVFAVVNLPIRKNDFTFKSELWVCGISKYGLESEFQKSNRAAVLNRGKLPGRLVEVQ